VRHSIIVDVVPPAQTHQQSSRDVLDRPKIGGQEEHHEHEAGQIAFLSFGFGFRSVLFFFCAFRSVPVAY